jgi:hypothetical protein
MDDVFIATTPEDNMYTCYKIQKGDIIRIHVKTIKGNPKLGSYIYANKNDCNLNVYEGEHVIGKVIKIITFKTILKSLFIRYYILHPIKLVKFLINTWGDNVEIECL